MSLPSPLEHMLERLPDARAQANGWYEHRCPAHDDQHASFGFRECPDGHLMVKCQAGCSQGAILQVLGMRARELYPESPHPNGASHQIMRTYDYHDPGGLLLFQVVRVRPKGFWQRRPDGTGGWIKDLKGVKRVLYHLPDVLSAKAAGATVYTVEGEKDADALRALGLCATTNPGGAGKWQSSYSETLTGTDVVILPDNDEAGTRHAELVRESLAGKAKSVRTLELPGLSEKEDVSDWLAKGGTREELERLVSETAQSVEVEPCEHIPGASCPASDLGNAERLVHRHGERIRYCHQQAQWLVWDGRRWAPDDTQEIVRLAVDTVRSIAEEAKGLEKEAYHYLLQHAMRSEGESRLAKMVRLGQSLLSVVVRQNDLDTDPWLLNCANGTLDLRTCCLRPHSGDDQITKIVSLPYLPDAPCPRWKDFLTQVLQGSEDLMTFLQRAAGYSLTGVVTERVIFILHGTGRNGKSTFLNALRYVFGDYGARTPTETLIVRLSGIPNDIARLVGTRFVTASEAEQGSALAEARVKDLTGGEPMAARFLNREFFEFTPQFKLWLGTNHVPEIRGTDEAIWDRIRLVPFGRRFADCEVDPTLKDVLRVEAAGILAWCVRGCREWQEGGLTYPVAVRRQTEAFRADMDTLIDFLSESCAVDPRGFVQSHCLYEAYREYCQASDVVPESSVYFARRMKERGFQKERTKAGVRWYGVRLAEQADQETRSGGLFPPYEPGVNG